MVKKWRDRFQGLWKRDLQRFGDFERLRLESPGLEPSHLKKAGHLEGKRGRKRSFFGDATIPNWRYCTWRYAGQTQSDFWPNLGKLLMENVLPTSWYGLYPIIYRVSYIPGGFLAGFRTNHQRRMTNLKDSEGRNPHFGGMPFSSFIIKWLARLVVSTHLKNMLVKLDHLPT